MDRQFAYTGAIPLATDLLSAQRNVLIGLGLLAQDLLGSSTLVGGLACTAAAPPSLNVSIGAGRVYAYTTVDATAYGALDADTVDMIVKQAILLQPTTLACAAPSTAGQSINYLIEAAYEDVDTNNTTLAYYNADNPSQPFSGPNNSGSPQPTTRSGQISLQAKPGLAATTGSQTTPAADSGYVGLYVVTVAYGQTTITSSNISTAAGAPFIGETLTAKIDQTIGDARYLQISVAATTYASLTALSNEVVSRIEGDSSTLSSAQTYASEAAANAQTNAQTYASGAAAAAQSAAVATAANASNLTSGTVPGARLNITVTADPGSGYPTSGAPYQEWDYF